MAVASNDFADEIEYLKLLTMMVIVSSRYYEESVFQQSNELPKLHSLSDRCLAHPLYGSLRGPCMVFYKDACVLMGERNEIIFT